MPRIPEIKTLTSNGVDILNAIRNSASSTYQERIPEATQDNIRQIGNAMMQYESTQNEFLDALVNRIGRVLITSKSYSNPLRRFKKGVLEFGETVEEVFVNVAKAVQYDPVDAEETLYKRTIPDVRTAFHKMNLQNLYPVTISNEQLRQAFLSYQGLSDLIARIVDSMYTGSEYDEFLCMKQQIVEAAQQGEFYPVNVPELTADNAKEIVTKIKAISNSFDFMSTTYNPVGVLTHSPKQSQVLLIDANFDASIDVNVLASAFNMNKAEFMGQRVLVDNFGELTGVVAALVDESWFMVFDNWIGFTENYNGKGLYWNYFYHVWKTFSRSPFANAVLFTTDKISVTRVNVTPGTAEITKGQSLILNSVVSTTGYAPKDVIWSVSGTEAVTSTIKQTKLNEAILTVPVTEANTTLTITAKSVYDSSKTGTATITLN
jgi:hypothetical protein